MTGRRETPSGAHNQVRVRRIRVGGRQMVAKSATGRRRSELRREAELLGHLADRSVIELTALRESDDRTDMVTDDAGAHTLADPPAMTPEELIESLATAAEAVADLHAAGWAHGAICAEHLIIDDAGSITLCSLGSAAMHEADGAAIGEDLLQLRAVIDAGLARRDHDRPLVQRRRWRQLTHRARRRLEDRRPGSDRRPHSARDLAESLRSVDVSHRRPAATPRTRQPARLTRTPATLVAAAAFVGVSALMWTTASSPVGVASAQPSPRRATAGPYSQSTTTAAPTTVTAPTTTSAPTPASAEHPPEELAVAGNEIRVGDVTYRAGADGDRLALADPDCTGTSRVLLLRPSTGQLFEFSEWPSTGRPARAHLRSLHPGAVDLEIIDPSPHIGRIAGAADAETGSDPDRQCRRLIVRYAHETSTTGPDAPAPVASSHPRAPSSQEEP